jgi:hypothetical protein
LHEFRLLTIDLVLAKIVEDIQSLASWDLMESLELDFNCGLPYIKHCEIIEILDLVRVDKVVQVASLVFLWWIPILPGHVKGVNLSEILIEKLDHLELVSLEVYGLIAGKLAQEGLLVD